MAKPTPIVRAGVYTRDGKRCVSCSAREVPLEFQHRRAVGMGGSKAQPNYDDGLTACSRCNSRYEGDLQRAALKYGWKVPRWVMHPGMVPVWYVNERTWYRLTRLGTRVPIDGPEAARMMYEVYGEGINGYGNWQEILGL